jgi:hypothetical protein
MDEPLGSAPSAVLDSATKHIQDNQGNSEKGFTIPDRETGVKHHFVMDADGTKELTQEELSAHPALEQLRPLEVVGIRYSVFREKEE